MQLLIKRGRGSEGELKFMCAFRGGQEAAGVQVWEVRGCMRVGGELEAAVLNGMRWGLSDMGMLG